jgi:hypothetical protein
MQNPGKRKERGAGPVNEFLFTAFLVLVFIAMLSGFFIPKNARAESLDRLRWEAPPALVADALMREAVDGRVADARCLKARTDVLVSFSVDRKGYVDRVRSLVAASADDLLANSPQAGLFLVRNECLQLGVF